MGSWLDALVNVIQNFQKDIQRGAPANEIEQNAKNTFRESFAPNQTWFLGNQKTQSEQSSQQSEQPYSQPYLQGPSYTQNSSDKSILPLAEEAKAGKENDEKENDEKNKNGSKAKGKPKKEYISHAGDAAIEYGGLLGAVPIVGPMAALATQTGGSIVNAVNSDYADSPYARTVENVVSNKDFVANPNILSMPDANDVSNMSDAHREQWLHDNGLTLGDWVLNTLLTGPVGSGIKASTKAAKASTEKMAKGLAEEATSYADDVAMGTGKEAAKESGEEAGKASSKEIDKAAREEAEKTAKFESEVTGREVTAEEVLARNTTAKPAEQVVEAAEGAERIVPDSKMLERNKASIDKSVEHWKNPETKSKYLEVIKNDLEKYPPEVQEFIKSQIPYATAPGKYWGARAAEPVLQSGKTLQDSLYMNAGKQAIGRMLDVLGQPLINQTFGSMAEAPEGETGLLINDDGTGTGTGTDIDPKNLKNDTGEDEENFAPIANREDPNKTYYGKTASELMRMYEDQIYDAAMADAAYKKAFEDAGYDLDKLGSYALYGNLGDSMDMESRRDVTRDIFGLNEGDNPLEIQGLRQIYKDNGTINDNMTKDEMLDAIMNRHWGADYIINPSEWMGKNDYELSHMLNGNTAAQKYSKYWLDNGYIPLPGGETWDDALKSMGGSMSYLDSNDIATMINAGNIANQIRNGVVFDPTLQISPVLQGAGDQSEFSWLDNADEVSPYSDWEKNTRNRDYSAEAIGQAMVNEYLKAHPELGQMPQATAQNINVYEPFGIDADIADFLAAEMEAKDRKGRHIGRKSKND